MTARVIVTIALTVLPLVARTDGPATASMHADRMASSIEARRAANVALIDATAAVNDAFIDAAAASDSFADELPALDAYAASLDQALEARRVGLETAVDLYTRKVGRLMGIAAYGQLDFFLTGIPALGAMGAVSIAAHEAHHTSREVGFQGIQDAAYNATGERERLSRPRRVR